MMVILIDSREQAPFAFEGFNDVVTEITGLPTGDYSLAGFEHMVAVERKELDDLIGCLQGTNRERFERELSRGATLHRFCVVVEATLGDVSRHHYRSRMEPKSALQSLFAFQVRYGTTFLFCGSQAGAEYACHGFLSKYLYEVERGFTRAIRAGHELKIPRYPAGKDTS